MYLAYILNKAIKFNSNKTFYVNNRSINIKLTLINPINQIFKLKIQHKMQCL